MSESVQKCAYCGKEATDLHRDHVVPRSRGGPDDAFNIVMACQSCNFAKRDSMASEWLGERCPHSVLLIETRVNAKLKSVFKKRDYKGTGEPRQEPKPAMFVITRDDDKKIAYVGEVLSESNGVVRLEAIDCVAMWAGLWCLSGEIYDVPREKCRLFNDKETCQRKAVQMVDELFPGIFKRHT